MTRGMDPERLAGSLAAYALAKPGAWADQPWGDDRVAKVGPAERGKIFAFLGTTTLGVKCGANRDVADEWLHRHPADASPMAYIGRSGWNTLRLDGAITEDELLEAVDESYRLVVSRMPKSLRPAAWDA
ncbi:MmcQ/YjbR family DNA-binding protein [Nocardioides sp. DS6]|uniref:MmcQ/YjbR family DNA-binding protein n=1 Tax=Nocardioides eburneus TaxID=3231482 RepID=A0ABV3SVR5_9ACTN